jgi:hypothetical protein
MSEYERPRVLASYSAEELVREAATCAVYDGTPSDGDLKEQIESIEGALGRVGTIRSR